MHKELFDISEKRLKLIYRVLKVVLLLYWSAFTLLFSFFCIERMCYPQGYKEIVFKYAEEFSLDSNLIFSVIRIESSFNEKAKSSAGAKGLMQITDKTGEYISKKLNKTSYDLFNPNDNIEFGCYYLDYLMERFNNLQTVLVAYNAGEGKVREWLNDERYSLDRENLIRIPYKETEEYVEKIQKSFAKYKKIYGNIVDKTKNIE